jgi:hypothetical protein
MKARVLLMLSLQARALRLSLYYSVHYFCLFCGAKMLNGAETPFTLP